jgi:pimeloyl-ACP methyl ester carboxylesterase
MNPCASNPEAAWARSPLRRITDMMLLYKSPMLALRRFEATHRASSRCLGRMGRISASIAALFALVATCVASEDHTDGLPGPAAIKESMYVRIGGIDQWLQIRGDDTANPVLLWLNGGPGSSTISSTYLYRPWEHQFTVVMWDQRGEGKTFEKSGESGAGPMTIDQMASDGIEVAQYLAKRLHKRNIVLLGHSWGSILGIHMVVRRPDLFSAYVGTGQVVKLHRQFEAGYPMLLQRASSISEARRELEKIGPPPWNTGDAYQVVNKWAGDLDPPEKANASSPMPSNMEPMPSYVMAGAQFSGRALFDAIGQVDMDRFATHFSIPIIFIQGSDDLLTTTSVVRAYFERIVAPTKYFVELPGTGHLAIFRDPDAFLAQMVLKVRPLAQSG